MAELSNIRLSEIMITWNDFEKIEMRVGTIIEASEFAEAKNPSYKIKINFGELQI